jgi:hypothetical protein
MILFEKTNFLTAGEYEETKNYFYGSNASWSFTGQTSDSDDTRFWYMNLMDQTFFAKLLDSRIRENYGGLGKLLQVYANGQTKLQEGAWHTDADSGVTFLWYLFFMLPEWGGRTLFRENELEDSYIPKANTIIAFPANLPHRSEAPTEQFHLLRVSVAWKYETL